MNSYLIPTYAPQPISFVKGAGSWLYTKDGSAYLDALTGIAVCGLGHCHPAVTKVIQEQAQTLVHTSNLFSIEWQEKAGELLCQTAGMDAVFFANSGAEANEAALKLARLYASQQGFKKAKVVVMERAFHGRTLLTVSATANPKARAGFFTLDDDFIRIDFGDIDALTQLAHKHHDICAVLLEPIQGEGGLNTAKDGFKYLNDVAKVCQQNNWLFMLDEVQTGNGRTGKPFAYQHANCKPDVLTTAKGLGNGFPVGACIVSGLAKNVFVGGSHGSTYGGNPLGSRVIYSVYEQLTTTEVMNNAHKSGALIKNTVLDEFKHAGITTRGEGMMIGIELPKHVDCKNIIAIARDKHKLIINLTAEHVIRLLPPLNLTQLETEQLIEKLIASIKQLNL